MSDTVVTSLIIAICVVVLLFGVYTKLPLEEINCRNAYPYGMSIQEAYEEGLFSAEDIRILEECGCSKKFYGEQQFAIESKVSKSMYKYCSHSLNIMSRIARIEFVISDSLRSLDFMGSTYEE